MLEPPSSIAGAAYAQAGYEPSIYNAGRLRNEPEIKARIDELMTEALEYSDIRISQVAVRLNRIASANIKDFKKQNGAWLDCDALPDRLAEAIRKVEFNKDGTVKNIELHDKERALTILLRHLGGLPPDGPAEVINNTQVNVITDEQRIAAVTSLLASARETTIDGAQEPAEQSSPWSNLRPYSENRISGWLGCWA